MPTENTEALENWWFVARGEPIVRPTRSGRPPFVAQLRAGLRLLNLFEGRNSHPQEIDRGVNGPNIPTIQAIAICKSRRAQIERQKRSKSNQTCRDCQPRGNSSNERTGNSAHVCQKRCW